MIRSNCLILYNLEIMTETHLKYILMECGLSTDDKTFRMLYSPDYITHKMTKQNFLSLNKKTLCFDWGENDFSFVEGSVSCSGVKLIFTNDWFRKILVSPLYDFKTGKIYNSVLAIPDYTEKDRFGKKKISQSSHIVRNQKDLDNYFKKLFKRFECPLVR